MSLKIYYRDHPKDDDLWTTERSIDEMSSNLSYTTGKIQIERSKITTIPITNGKIVFVIDLSDLDEKVIISKTIERAQRIAILEDTNHVNIAASMRFLAHDVF
jgi:hypothetical protein